jgi:hypothetical protein
MRVRGTTEDVGFEPYTILDLHELPEDGEGFGLEDGWLVEVAASSRHNWALRNLSRIIEDAAARAGSPVIVCPGGEWEVSTPAGIRKPDACVIPRETARAVILDGHRRSSPAANFCWSRKSSLPGAAASVPTGCARSVSTHRRSRTGGGCSGGQVIHHLVRPSFAAHPLTP